MLYLSWCSTWTPHCSICNPLRTSDSRSGHSPPRKQLHPVRSWGRGRSCSPSAGSFCPGNLQGWSSIPWMKDLLGHVAWYYTHSCLKSCICQKSHFCGQVHHIAGISAEKMPLISFRTYLKFVTYGVGVKFFHRCRKKIKLTQNGLFWTKCEFLIFSHSACSILVSYTILSLCNFVVFTHF